MAVQKNFVVKNGLEVGDSASIAGVLVASGITYPTSDGTASQVIVTDGAGNLSFESVLDSANVSSIITTNVNKAFVDALNVDADTLDSQNGSYYLDYTNFTNKPNILDSAQVLAIAEPTALALAIALG